MAGPWQAGTTESEVGSRWLTPAAPTSGVLRWWRGTTLAYAERLGWWDGAVIQPDVELLGYWDGAVIQPAE